MNRMCVMLGASFLVLSFPASALLPAECGSLTNGYGPYDYTNYEDFTQRLQIVEINHLTPDVLALKNAGPHALLAPPGGGLEYTLRAFPNHHKALEALIRLSMRDKSAKPAGMPHTVDCYFLRAMEFQPKDAMIPMLYGVYQYRMQKYKESMEWYRRAEQMGTPSPELHYNMGLTAFKMNDIDTARTYAAKAYEKGYPLPWLRNALKDYDKKNQKQPK